MPFQYKKIRTPEFPSFFAPPAKEYDLNDEVLTGYVQGMDASDIEERFARALNTSQLPYGFRVQIMNAGGNPIIVNQADRNSLGVVEVDFLVDKYGTFYPFNIDGEYSHKTSVQREADAEKDRKLNELLKVWNAQPMARVPYYQLDNQENANRVIREIL